MKTTERFNRAVKKLYTAFHNGTLNAFDWKACAVGNIVGHGVWKGANGMCDRLGRYCSFDDQYNYNEYPKDGDYVGHYREIEKRFLNAWTGKNNKGTNKEIQFEGLCAVVEYLAELDGIPNPMDYTKLFETTESGEPKHELI